MNKIYKVVWSWACRSTLLHKSGGGDVYAQRRGEAPVSKSGLCRDSRFFAEKDAQGGHHQLCRMAVPPLPAEPAHGRGAVGRARDRSRVRDGAQLGENTSGDRQAHSFDGARRTSTAPRLEQPSREFALAPTGAREGDVALQMSTPAATIRFGPRTGVESVHGMPLQPERAVQTRSPRPSLLRLGLGFLRPHGRVSRATFVRHRPCSSASRTT